MTILATEIPVIVLGFYGALIYTYLKVNATSHNTPAVLATSKDISLIFKLVDSIKGSSGT